MLLVTFLFWYACLNLVFAICFLAIPGLQTQWGQGWLLQVATIITQESQPYEAASRDQQPANQILRRKLLQGWWLVEKWTYIKIPNIDFIACKTSNVFEAWHVPPWHLQASQTLYCVRNSTCGTPATSTRKAWSIKEFLLALRNKKRRVWVKPKLAYIGFKFDTGLNFSLTNITASFDFFWCILQLASPRDLSLCCCFQPWSKLDVYSIRSRLP